MNMIKFDYEKLKNLISDYILNNNEVIFISYETGTTDVNTPIILMNLETLDLLKNDNMVHKNTNIIPTMHSCHIAIADWLKFGEVQIR